MPYNISFIKEVTMRVMDFREDVLKQKFRNHYNMSVFVAMNNHYKITKYDTDNEILFFISDGDMPVGYMLVLKDKTRLQIRDTFISSSYRSRGIGHWFYNVLSNIYKLFSDKTLSPGARKIWNHLVNNGQAFKINDDYVMKGCKS